jgi:hypothetical protein
MSWTGIIKVHKISYMSLIKRPPTLKMAPPGSHVVKRHIKVSHKGVKYYVKAHIRKNRGKNEKLLPENLLYLYWYGDQDYPPIGAVKGFAEFPEFDPIIQFWLNFWKEQGLPFPEGLDPLLIKVIIAKESSFRSQIKTKAKNSSATGLMQILQSTLYRLEGVPENNFVEVQGHFLQLKLGDLADPVINIATGIRWLSHKYYLLLKSKEVKRKDLYSTVKYYHQWNKLGEAYADEIFKLYHESLNKRLPVP